MDEPEQKAREQVLGQRGQRRKGALQAAIGIAELAAGDGQVGQLIEAFGEGLQGAWLELGVVVEQEHELGR